MGTRPSKTPRPVLLDAEKDLGTLIRAMRAFSGLRQRELAKSMKISRGLLSNLESGVTCTVLLKHLVMAGEKCGFEVMLKVRRIKP